MKSKESAPSIDSWERNDERDGQRLDTLWRRYGFAGNPPTAGSAAQERLEDYCRRYMDVLTDEVMTKGNNASLSDSLRRELHNNIALMTVGSERSVLDDEEGKRIANFASELIFGTTLVNVYEDLRKSRENQE